MKFNNKRLKNWRWWVSLIPLGIIWIILTLLHLGGDLCEWVAKWLRKGYNGKTPRVFKVWLDWVSRGDK